MSQRVSGFERIVGDNYPSPAWVVGAIVPRLRTLCPRVWEPAHGDGNLTTALRDAGFHIVGTGGNFFAHNKLPDPRITGIVTNPPYGSKGRLAVRFIEHALELAPVVVMLARVDFDSAKSRTHLFRDNPRFAGRVTLLDRIQWFPGPKRPSDNHAWFFWTQTTRGRPRCPMRGASETVDSTVAERISKVMLVLLGASTAGERTAAAEALARVVTETGTDMHELAARITGGGVLQESDAALIHQAGVELGIEKGIEIGRRQKAPMSQMADSEIAEACLKAIGRFPSKHHKFIRKMHFQTVETSRPITDPQRKYLRDLYLQQVI